MPDTEVLEDINGGEGHEHLCWYCWRITPCTVSGCKDAPADYRCDECGVVDGALLFFLGSDSRISLEPLTPDPLMFGRRPHRVKVTDAVQRPI